MLTVDIALGGTLSSYTWLCMIINFLQCRHPKILPTLQKPPYFVPTPGASAGFNEALDLTKDFGKLNREPLGELLFAFFRRYAHEVDYERFVISVREGGLISKLEKTWHTSQNTRLCVEEPFNISRNLGNTADDTSFRGVHLELRRAFDLMSHGKLEECCEEYIFPANEERAGRNQNIFTKPVSQPRPVLTRSQSQTGSNRTPRQSVDSKRNGLPNQKQRTGSSNRRASSAVPHKLNLHPIQFFDPTASGSQLHETLAHQYQNLQRQEQHLRMKMQGSSNLSGHVLVSSNGSGYYVDPHLQPGVESQRRHSTASGRSHHVPLPQFTPLTNMPGIASFLPPGFLSTQSRSPQTVTSPPSPSLSYVQPRHRANTRRSATADAAGLYTSTRSHSQPPANNPTALQQVVYMYPETYVYPERQRLPLGHRTLQDVQNDYLFHQQRLANDDGTMSLNSAKLSSFDSPNIGSEVDCASVPDDRLFRDNLPSVQDDQPIPLPYTEDASHNHQQHRVEHTLANYVPKPLQPRPRSNSLLSTPHGISFFAVEAADSPPQRHSFPIRIPDFPTSQARGIHPDADRLAMLDGNGFFEHQTSPEHFGDYVAARSTYSIDSTATPASSIGTPSQEQNEPLAIDGTAERVPAQKPPAAIQFGQFPARAPYRTGQQLKSDDMRSGSTLHGSGKGLYSQTLSGLGINLTNDHNDSALINGAPTMKQSSTVAGLNLASTLKPGSILSPVREVRTPSPTATRNGGAVTYPQPSTMLNQAAMNEANEFSPVSGRPEANGRTRMHHRARSVESVRTPSSKQPQINSPSAKTNIPHKQPQIDSPSIKTNVPQTGQSSKSAQTRMGEAPGNEGTQYPQHVIQSVSQIGLQQSGWQQTGNGKKKKSNTSKKSASVGSVIVPADLSERKGG